MNVCVVINVAIIMPLKDFGPYGIIFMTVCLLL
jgi:type IV secretory pathway component VirB8